jgi:hypothetical protein
MRNRVRFVALALASFVLSFLGSFFAPSAFLNRLLASALCSLLSFQSNACLAQLPRVSERAVAAVSTLPAEKPSNNNEVQKVAGCLFGVCVDLPKIPIPGGSNLGGNLIEQAKAAIIKQVGQAIGVGSPLLLDQKTAFDQAPNITDFHPQLITVSSVEDLQKPLPPGDYSLPVTAYCTQFSIHAPGQGLPYKLARVQGKQATAISTLIVRGTLQNIAPATLNAEAWRIQAGMPLKQWPPEDQALIHKLIPEYEKDLEGDYLQQIENTYNQYRVVPGIPSFNDLLKQLGPPGQLVLQLRQARQVLSDQTIAAERLPDMLYEPTGDGLPRVLPAAKESSPSPWAEVQPGIFARFSVIEGNLGRNLLEFRITPKAGKTSAVSPDIRLASLKLTQVQAITASPTLLRIIGGVATAAEIGAAGEIILPLLIVYSIGTAAQALILMAQIGNKEKTEPFPIPIAIDEKCPYAVRAGIATPVQIQKGVAEHIHSPGITGFSVQSAPGKTIEELAAAGLFPNPQISVTTVCALNSVGVPVVPTPGRGYHNTAVTPMPLSNEQAAVISAVFTTRPNPAQVKK